LARAARNGGGEQRVYGIASLVERLRETLTEEQKLLLRDCENAYRVAEGETEQFYYRAGFSDAIKFLLGFGEEQ
jgi:hypothetical protein